MAEISRELVNLNDLDDPGLFDVSEAVNGHVANPHVRDVLVKRNFRGVLRQHSGSPVDSFTELKRARGRQAAEQGLAAYAIFDEEHRVTGLGSIQDSLKLWRPKYDLPTKLTRHWPLGKLIPTPQFNVSVWDASFEAAALTPSYQFLGNEQPDSWTIEQADGGSVSARNRVTAIQDAGFEGASLTMYGPVCLDDQEIPGRERGVLGSFLLLNERRSLLTVH